VPYDNLLLATGSRAQRIPVPGADLPGVVTMWTLDDAHDALQFLPDDAQACIVGKGFIGGIILNALYKRGCRLKVVELADHVLPRMLDAEAATLVERWLTERGVELYLPAQVNAIHAGTRKRIELKDGRELEADLVVLATGIAANTELAQAAGIRVDRGILIDRHCATSAAGVFAGGDCAQGPDLLSDNPDVHAIQPTAVDHGRVAGANMAGRAVEYPGSLLLNILDVCGLQCASFGDWSGRGREQQLIVNETRPLYRKLVWEGDRIVGAIFVGPMDDVCMLNDVGMAKGFIQTRANLGTWKHYILANPADLRRPYVGVGVPERLVEFQLLGQPSRSRGYRYQDRQPVSVETEAHAIFVGTRAEAAAAAPPAAPAGEAKH
jgi:NAD(P)H-nitrite reductase large subunit